MDDSNFAKKYKLHERQTAAYWLAILAFLESSVFLLPVDVIYIPMLLARPQKAYKYAFIATVFSVLGALLGWFIGAFAYKTIALPVLEFYDKTAYFEHLRSISNIKFIILFLITSGLVHLPPIKLVNILAGLIHVNLPLFLILNLSARTLRLYGLAWLVTTYGNRFKEFLRPYIQPFFVKEVRFRLISGTIFLLSLVVVFASFYLQYGAGFIPCNLCYIERYLFIAALFFSGFLLLLDFIWPKAKLLKYVTSWSLTILLISNMLVSIYHTGIERHWWAGPKSCAAQATALAHNSKDLLQALGQPHRASCDIAAGHFLHLPFTAWSFVFSLVLVLFSTQLFGCFRADKSCTDLQ